MPQPTLEQRLAVIEREVAELKVAMNSAVRTKDWRRTIGVFSDDPGMQQIFDEAMKLREADRQKARRKPASKQRVAK